MALLQGMGIPGWVQGSARYNALFDGLADEMDLPVQAQPVTADSSGHLLNTVDAFARPGSDLERDLSRLSAADRAGHPTIGKYAGDVVDEIERRRQVMVQGAMGVFPVSQSGTFLHDKQAALNPAEREWVLLVADDLYEASQAIFGHQVMPRADETLAWVREHGDPVSRFHFERTRGFPFRAPPVTEFPEAGRYADSLPWYPDLPPYTHMWPADLSKEELSYLGKTYPADDPILLPYTRVTRIAEDQARQIETAPLSCDGQPVEWARRGPDGRWYRVVNMAFDTAMRPHFLKIADSLRNHAGIEVEGATLHPQFRNYLLTAARCLESGDFIGLLKADLEQTEGPLYLSIFTHEGYGDDGIKYPLSLDLAIRDEELPRSAQGHEYVIDWLGQEVERVARRAGLVDYQAPVFESGDLRKAAVFGWFLRTGGFMRAFTRDPGGHDYPKRDFPGITGHRNVILLDVMETWAPLTQEVARLLFGPEVAQYVTFWGVSRDAFLHEAGHGSQIRQNVKTLSGQPFSDALGDRWGVLVEPWADAGSLLAHYKLFHDGKINERQLREVVFSGIVYNFTRLYPREVAKSDDIARGGPHIAGSSMFLGWLYHEGVIVSEADGSLRIEEGSIEESLRRFFERLTELAAGGDREAFLAFVDETIGWFPEDLERTVLAKKSSVPAYSILDRGELKLPV